MLYRFNCHDSTSKVCKIWFAKKNPKWRTTKVINNALHVLISVWAVQLRPCHSAAGCLAIKQHRAITLLNCLSGVVPTWRFFKLKRASDTSVAVATGYSLNGKESIPRGRFSLHYSVLTGYGAHPAFYPMGTKGNLLGDKAAETWSWPLTSI
jgi:hypothetical protein